MKARIVQIVGSFIQERFRWIVILIGVSILLALQVWHMWPGIFHRLFLVLVPVWILKHIFLAALSEARLFIFPHAVLLLPAAFPAPQGECNEVR